jgi:hypothetical protein
VRQIETVEVILPKEKELVVLNTGLKGGRGVSITDFTLDDDGNAVTTFDDGNTKVTKLTYVANASVSAKKAAISEANAKDYADKALSSETNARTSEANASTYANNANESKVAAKVSETNAKASASASATSASNAKTSETNASDSERFSLVSASLAEAWASSTTSPDNITDASSPTGQAQSSRSWALNSKDSAQRASSSASIATAQATSASNSFKEVSKLAAEASTSASNASTSAEKAKTSETNAANSESNALQYKDSALESKTASATSERNAAKSEINAKASMNSASVSATSASTSATNAGISEGHAATSETNAKQALTESKKIQKEVESALTKVTGFAKYSGSVDNYSDLPLTGMNTGDVWNIVNADVAHQIKAGDNVIWNGKTWDNLSGFVDLSNYPTNSDVAKAIVDTTYSGGTITFIHKDGTKSTATIGDTSHAIQADQDGEGNVIADTYYKKADASTIHQSFQNQINSKQDKLTFDKIPTAGSTNPVTSDGVRKAIDEKTVDFSNYYTKAQVNTAVSTAKTEIEGKIPKVDARLSTTSENPVQNKVIKAELSNYVTSSDVSATLSQYAKKTDVPAITVSGNTISFGSVTIGVD